MTKRVLLISRRAFLRVGTGALALGGVGVLAACGQSTPTAPQPTSAAPAAAAPTSPPAPTSAPAPATVAPALVTPAPARASSGAVQLPTHIPLAGITPDLPPSDDGRIDAGFVNYPANPLKTVQDTPGLGGEISAITWTTGAPPTPMDSNQLWQAVNKALGVTLKISILAQADYATVKLPTVVAGDELPDILYIAPNAVIPEYPTFLKSKMADLTPYLSGDAVKDYPNLANIPTIAWRQMVINNTIYGIPCANSLFLWVHWVHQDLLDADGLADPRTADEYKQLAVHFTRPDQNLYGLGAENAVGMGMTNGWMTGIFGAPNGWVLDDKTGKMTYTLETDQYRAAVGYARDLWAAGAYTPNAMQYNLVSARNDMAARRFAFRMDAFAVASDLFWAGAAKRDPPGNPRVLAPFPAMGGGTPTYWTTPGILGYSVIKQAPPDRIKGILRVLNWLAAPLGTQEYLLKTYGLKDVHWTPDDNGNPILNDRGKADATVPFHYLTRAPNVLYWPATPQNTPVMHDVQKAIYPYMSTNAADPYYSPTNSSKSPALNSALNDKLNDIVIGRQPLEAFDQAVKDWQTGGGNQMRQEYEQAVAAAHG
jgi:putative aldouronate transport system substrate-binding protein